MQSSKFITGLIFITLLFGIYGCSDNGKPDSAIEYNNIIVNAQNRITEKMLTLSEVLNNGEVAKMDSVYNLLRAEIEGSVKEVRSLSPFDGDSSLRDTAIELFIFYNDITENEYKTLIELYRKPDVFFTATDEEWINNMVIDIGKREELLDDKFSEVQREFALKHNFTIIKNKLQDKIDSL